MTAGGNSLGCRRTPHGPRPNNSNVRSKTVYAGVIRITTYGLLLWFPPLAGGLVSSPEPIERFVKGGVTGKFEGEPASALVIDETNGEDLFLSSTLAEQAGCRSGNPADFPSQSFAYAGRLQICCRRGKERWNRRTSAHWRPASLQLHSPEPTTTLSFLRKQLATAGV